MKKACCFLEYLYAHNRHTTAASVCVWTLFHRAAQPEWVVSSKTGDAVRKQTTVCQGSSFYPGSCAFAGSGALYVSCWNASTEEQTMVIGVFCIFGLSQHANCVGYAEVLSQDKIVNNLHNWVKMLF